MSAGPRPWRQAAREVMLASAQDEASRAGRPAAGYLYRWEHVQAVVAPALSVAVRGRLAAIGAHARGVHLVDIADPAAGSGRVPLRFGASFMAVASGAVWRRRAAGPRGWPWRRRPARRSA